jgi:hypothetical protein
MIKKNLDKIVALAAIVFAVVSLLMIFANAAVQESTGHTFSGANLIFGYTETTELLGKKISTTIFNFSANFVTFILLIVGIVAVVLALLGKFQKIATIVAAAAFIVAGVFYFLMIQFCSPYTTLTGDNAAKYVQTVKDSLTLGAGAIVGGIFAIVAGLASASLLFIKK